MWPDEQHVFTKVNANRQLLHVWEEREKGGSYLNLRRLFFCAFTIDLLQMVNCWPTKTWEETHRGGTVDIGAFRRIPTRCSGKHWIFLPNPVVLITISNSVRKCDTESKENRWYAEIEQNPLPPINIKRLRLIDVTKAPNVHHRPIFSHISGNILKYDTRD